MQSSDLQNSSGEQKRNTVDKENRRRRFFSNWHIGMPMGLALGAGIGFATQNILVGLIVGLVLGGLSGFVVAFLKWLVDAES